MSEIRTLVGVLLNKGANVEDILREVVSCVYETVSCPDCLSDVKISRIVTNVDVANYVVSVLHDETCPNPEVGAWTCGECPD